MTMKSLPVVVLALSALLVASTASMADSLTFGELTSLFRYDPQISLDIHERTLPDKNGIGVLDISFASADGKTVDAFLLLPEGDGPFPAVIFVHWGFGSRSQFLDEANLLAQTGVGSLLVNAPFGDSRTHFVQSIVNLRRAVDVVASYRQIDPHRIGYVGHSWGGTLGGILAGVENRIRAFVLMAGFPSYADYAKRKDLESFAGDRYVGHATPAAIFFQFAEADAIVTREAAERYFDAASEPKTIRWYPQATHKFRNEEARADRLKWLLKKLN